MSKVCLIDGSGYIFRAFYALPNMTSPDGVPVNAVYGFVTMFMRLLNSIECDYCVVLLDAHRRNFRNEIFEFYKSNRSDPPELLIPQFSLIRRAIKVMGLPYVEQEGFEADDLIASYTKQSLDKGYEVIIVSGDKDLMQLIRPGVSFYDGMKEKFFTEEDVKEKFGVYPERVVDVQALAGDKTDNIPGVPGIGIKIAAELVNEYGSLCGVLDNIENIKQARRRDLLREHKESAEISLQLVTLKDDIKLDRDIEEFKCISPDTDELLGFIDSLGFKAIRPKLEKWSQERAGGASEHESEETNSKVEDIAKPLNYEKVVNYSQLRDLKEKIKTNSRVAISVHHDTKQFCGISLSTNSYEGYYLPLLSYAQKDDLFAVDDSIYLTKSAIVEFLQDIIEDKNILKIAADIKTNWHRLEDICGKSLDLSPFDDISVMSYDLDSSQHGHTIQAMSSYFLATDLADPKPVNKNSAIDFEKEEFGRFIFEVADYTMRLYAILKERIFKEKKNFIYDGMDKPLIPVLMNMERVGIVINDVALSELDEAFSCHIKEIEKRIFELAGEEFNLNAPMQIGTILYDKMGLKGKKNASGSYNTSAEVLELLAEENEIVAKILEWRMYNKLKTTYTKALLEAKDKNHRVHTTFSQTVVNTGRLASSNPNLQNIPIRTELGRRIRGCFEAQKGYTLVAVDYSQMELRLIASYANVKTLREAFWQKVDIHTATASRVFGIPREKIDKEHRHRAKAINFGIIYGISQFGLAKQIGISNEEAQMYIDAYLRIMPEVKRYMDETMEFAHTNGYVETPFGRKCYIGGISGGNRRAAAFAERAAINAPIQGGAADIVKMAMIKVDNALRAKKLDARLLLQVHDELVIEAKEEIAPQVAELVKEIMENVVKMPVEFVADAGIGKNWNEAH